MKFLKMSSMRFFKDLMPLNEKGNSYKSLQVLLIGVLLMVFATLVKGQPAHIAKWGSRGNADGQFYDYPGGIAIDRNDNVYVADYGNKRIQKFNSDGQHLLNITAGLSLPKNIAVDKLGNLYVTDLDAVKKISPTGQLLASFGGTGASEGKFSTAGGIALDASGNIYVTDIYNNRIQKLSPTGIPLKVWSSYGVNQQSFFMPSYIAIDNNGNMFISEPYSERILKFDSDGNYIDSFGSKGTGNGQFDSPGSILIDSKGNIYICDKGNHRIQRFNSVGKHEFNIGKMGSGDAELLVPMGLALDSKGFLYVTELRNKRIQKFGCPIVNAGSPQTVLGKIVNLTGSVSPGVTGTWTASIPGTFSPDANTPNATFTATNNFTTDTDVSFTLTVPEGFGCPAVSSTVVHKFSSGEWYQIPDPYFAQYLYVRDIVLGIKGCITEDGKLKTDCAGVKALKKLELQNSRIESLDGIQFFTGLTELHCNLNQIKKLDLRSNTSLDYLACGHNKLELLNVKNCKKLQILDCRSNENLKNLDVGSNTLLYVLNCSNNGLKTLDLKNNPNLTSLDFSNNFISSLDLSNHSILEVIICNNNPNLACFSYLPDALSRLDFEDCPKLKCLPNYPIKFGNNKPLPLCVEAGENKSVCGNSVTLEGSVIKGNGTWTPSLPGVFLPNANTPTANFTPTPALSTSTDITLNLDVPAADGCPAASKSVVITFNPPPSVSAGASQTVKGKTVTLDGSVSPGFIGTWTPSIPGTFSPDANTPNATFTATNDFTTDTDVTFTLTVPAGNGCPEGSSTVTIKFFEPVVVFEDAKFKLAVVDNYSINTNKDGEIQISEARAATSLDISYKEIILMGGIEEFKNLTSLNCKYNQIEAVDLSENILLEFLDCRSNKLANLDIKDNKKITHLDCEDNPLGELDVSENGNLYWLFCSATNLTSLDVSQNKLLAYLNCHSNALDKLEVKNNFELVHLDCSNNYIKNLDLSNNKKLTGLGVQINNLEELLVTNNTALTWLNCALNQLTSLDISANTALVEINCIGNKKLCNISALPGSAKKFHFVDTEIKCFPGSKPENLETSWTSCPPDPTISAGVPQTVTGKTVTLNGTISSGTGTWTTSSVSGTFSPDANTPNATFTSDINIPVVADIPFTFTAKSGNGCSEISSSVIVTFLPLDCNSNIEDNGSEYIITVKSLADDPTMNQSNYMDKCDFSLRWALLHIKQMALRMPNYNYRINFDFSGVTANSNGEYNIILASALPTLEANITIAGNPSESGVNPKIWIDGKNVNSGAIFNVINAGATFNNFCLKNIKDKGIEISRNPSSDQTIKDEYFAYLENIIFVNEDDIFENVAKSQIISVAFTSNINTIYNIKNCNFGRDRENKYNGKFLTLIKNPIGYNAPSDYSYIANSNFYNSIQEAVACNYDYYSNLKSGLNLNKILISNPVFIDNKLNISSSFGAPKITGYEGGKLKGIYEVPYVSNNLENNEQDVIRTNPNIYIFKSNSNGIDALSYVGSTEIKSSTKDETRSVYIFDWEFSLQEEGNYICYGYGMINGGLIDRLTTFSNSFNVECKINLPTTTTFCQNASPILLTGNLASSTFSGPGVTGDLVSGFYFNPSIAGLGIHTIKNQCGDEVQLTVISTPEVQAAEVSPTVIYGNTVKLNGNVSTGYTSEWSSTASGTFTNINDPKASYTLNDPVSNVTDVTLTLTIPASSGCPEVSSSVILKFAPANLFLIPDPNFRKYLYTKRVDLGIDGCITEDGWLNTTCEGVKSLGRISVENFEIEDVTGIEYFPKLNFLNVTGNKISKIDVSKNSELWGLFVGINKLKTIDVSKNQKLLRFWCYNNELESIDLTYNLKLRDFTGPHNKLSSINVINNKELENLDCSSNPTLRCISSLPNTITSLTIYGTEITCLPNKPSGLNITLPICENNFSAGINQRVCTNSVQLNGKFSSDGSGFWTANVDGTFSPDANTPTATFTPNDFPSSDVILTLTEGKGTGCPTSSNVTVKFSHPPVVSAGENKTARGKTVLLEGSVSNGSTGTWSTSLPGTFSPDANASNPTFTATNDITEETQITFTYTIPPNDGCEEISSTVEISFLPGWYEIPDLKFREYLYTNAEILGIEGCITEEGLLNTECGAVKSLTGLNVNKKQIANLDGIQFFTGLTVLNCSQNPLLNLDISKNTALTILRCALTQLTSLDISNNSALTDLILSRCKITKLDLSKNSNLKILYCSYNQLKELNLSKNLSLTNIVCSFNQLKTLDVSNNTFLVNLHCNDNKLLSLDVSKNELLTNLNCRNNYNLCNLSILPNTLTSLNVINTNITCLPNKPSKLTTTLPLCPGVPYEHHITQVTVDGVLYDNQFVVTRTHDFDPSLVAEDFSNFDECQFVGTLRWALMSANRLPKAGLKNRIVFNIVYPIKDIELESDLVLSSGTGTSPNNLFIVGIIPSNPETDAPSIINLNDKQFTRNNNDGVYFENLLLGNSTRAIVSSASNSGTLSFKNCQILNPLEKNSSVLFEFTGNQQSGINNYLANTIIGKERIGFFQDFGRIEHLFNADASPFIINNCEFYNFNNSVISKNSQALVAKSLFINNTKNIENLNFTTTISGVNRDGRLYGNTSNLEATRVEIYKAGDNGIDAITYMGFALVKDGNWEYDKSLDISNKELIGGENYLAVASTNLTTGEFSSAFTFEIVIPCNIVTSTIDEGHGSLRNAIECVNAKQEPTTIFFEIPGSSPINIELTSTLPAVKNTYGHAITIDGTDKGIVLTPKGGNTAVGPLTITSGSHVKGIAFKSFSGAAVKLVDGASLTNTYFESNNYSVVVENSEGNTTQNTIKQSIFSKGVTADVLTSPLEGVSTGEGNLSIEGCYFFGGKHGISHNESDRSASITIKDNYFGYNPITKLAEAMSGNGISVMSKNEQTGSISATGNYFTSCTVGAIKVNTHEVNISDNYLGYAPNGSVSSNGYGIWVTGQKKSNIIKGNLISKTNLFAIKVSDNEVSEATINANYIGYTFNKTPLPDFAGNSTSAAIELEKVKEQTVVGNYIFGYSKGLNLKSSADNTVNLNDLVKVSLGLRLEQSSSNKIEGNTTEGGETALYLENSSSNNILKNTFKGAQSNALSLNANSNSNTLEQNEILESTLTNSFTAIGIYIGETCDGNKLEYGKIQNSTLSGVNIQGSAKGNIVSKVIINPSAGSAVALEKGITDPTIFGNENRATPSIGKVSLDRDNVVISVSSLGTDKIEAYFSAPSSAGAEKLLVYIGDAMMGGATTKEFTFKIETLRAIMEESLPGSETMYIRVTGTNASGTSRVSNMVSICPTCICLVENTQDGTSPVPAKSLREAMSKANVGECGKIKFNIPTQGALTSTIELTEKLPSIINGYTIDATSQSGYVTDNSPVVYIKANTSNAQGLLVDTKGATIKGLGVDGFEIGIVLAAGSKNNTFENCHITGSEKQNMVFKASSVGNAFYKGSLTKSGKGGISHRGAIKFEGAGVQNNVKAPTILSHSYLAGDKIELILQGGKTTKLVQVYAGNSTPQNAVQYLTPESIEEGPSADATQTTWKVVFSNTSYTTGNPYYFVATVTDQENNTSPLSKLYRTNAEFEECIVYTTDERGLGSIREAETCVNLAETKARVVFDFNDGQEKLISLTTNNLTFKNPFGLLVDPIGKKVTLNGTSPVNIVIDGPNTKIEGFKVNGLNTEITTGGNHIVKDISFEQSVLTVKTTGELVNIAGNTFGENARLIVDGTQKVRISNNIFKNPGAGAKAISLINNGNSNKAIPELKLLDLYEGKLKFELKTNEGGDIVELFLGAQGGQRVLKLIGTYVTDKVSKKLETEIDLSSLSGALINATGLYIAGTAIGQDWNTSELSPNMAMTTCFVENASDADVDGSLRRAVIRTNKNECNIIAFAIPESITPEIKLLSNLPAINSSVIIDATSIQAGYIFGGDPVVKISKEKANGNDNKNNNGGKDKGKPSDPGNPNERLGIQFGAISGASVNGLIFENQDKGLGLVSAKDLRLKNNHFRSCNEGLYLAVGSENIIADKCTWGGVDTELKLNNKLAISSPGATNFTVKNSKFYINDGNKGVDLSGVNGFGFYENVIRSTNGSIDGVSVASEGMILTQVGIDSVDANEWVDVANPIRVKESNGIISRNIFNKISKDQKGESGTGIEVEKCSTLTVKFNEFHDYRTKAIVLRSNTERNIIFDNTIDSAAVTGIELITSSQQKVAGNQVYKSLAYGIQIDAANKQDSIVGNNLKNCKVAGMEVKGSELIILRNIIGDLARRGKQGNNKGMIITGSNNTIGSYGNGNYISNNNFGGIENNGHGNRIVFNSFVHNDTNRTKSVYYAIENKNGANRGIQAPKDLSYTREGDIYTVYGKATSGDSIHIYFSNGYPQDAIKLMALTKAAADGSWKVDIKKEALDPDRTSYIVATATKEEGVYGNTSPLSKIIPIGPCIISEVEDVPDNDYPLEGSVRAAVACANGVPEKAEIITKVYGEPLVELKAVLPAVSNPKGMSWSGKNIAMPFIAQNLHLSNKQEAKAEELLPYSVEIKIPASEGVVPALSSIDFSFFTAAIKTDKGNLALGFIRAFGRPDMENESFALLQVPQGVDNLVMNNIEGSHLTSVISSVNTTNLKFTNLKLIKGRFNQTKALFNTKVSLENSDLEKGVWKNAGEWLRAASLKTVTLDSVAFLYDNTLKDEKNLQTVMKVDNADGITLTNVKIDATKCESALGEGRYLLSFAKISNATFQKDTIIANTLSSTVTNGMLLGAEGEKGNSNLILTQNVMRVSGNGIVLNDGEKNVLNGNIISSGLVAIKATKLTISSIINSQLHTDNKSAIELRSSQQVIMRRNLMEGNKGTTRAVNLFLNTAEASNKTLDGKKREIPTIITIEAVEQTGKRPYLVMRGKGMPKDKIELYISQGPGNEKTEDDEFELSSADQARGLEINYASTKKFLSDKIEANEKGEWSYLIPKPWYRNQKDTIYLTVQATSEQGNSSELSNVYEFKPFQKEYIVINTKDAGEGSLRKGFEQINATDFYTKVIFNIQDNNQALPGPHTIKLESALPSIGNYSGFSINGRTQIDYYAVKNELSKETDHSIKVEAGNQATAGNWGIEVRTECGDSTRIRNLILSGFTKGIHLKSGQVKVDSVTIESPAANGVVAMRVEAVSNPPAEIEENNGELTELYPLTDLSQRVNGNSIIGYQKGIEVAPEVASITISNNYFDKVGKGLELLAGTKKSIIEKNTFLNVSNSAIVLTGEIDEKQHNTIQHNWFGYDSLKQTYAQTMNNAVHGVNISGNYFLYNRIANIKGSTDGSAYKETGLYFEGQGEENYIQNNYFGYYASQEDLKTFTSGNDAVGIVFGGQGTVKANKVLDNKFAGIGEGLVLQNGSNNIISGNYIGATTTIDEETLKEKVASLPMYKDAITISGGSLNSIVGNTIANFGKTNSGYGIKLRNAAKEVMISKNIIFSEGLEDGIYFEDGAASNNGQADRKPNFNSYALEQKNLNLKGNIPKFDGAKKGNIELFLANKKTSQSVEYIGYAIVDGKGEWNMTVPFDMLDFGGANYFVASYTDASLNTSPYSLPFVVDKLVCDLNDDVFRLKDPLMICPGEETYNYIDLPKINVTISRKITNDNGAESIDYIKEESDVRGYKYKIDKEGEYTIKAVSKTDNSCFKNVGFKVNYKASPSKPDFLVKDTVYVGDTIALVDLNYELPGRNIQWGHEEGLEIPLSALIDSKKLEKPLESHDKKYKYITFPKTGSKVITQTSTEGECAITLSKTVEVQPQPNDKREKVKVPVTAAKFIDATIFPNPADRAANLIVSFKTDIEEPFSLSIYNINASDPIQRYYYTKEDLKKLPSGEFEFQTVLRQWQSLPSGVYIVKLEMLYDVKVLKLLIQ